MTRLHSQLPGPPRRRPRPGGPLHLVLEVKGYRHLDADVKKATMQTLWVPGVNRLGSYGRWAFLELDEHAFGFGDFADPDAKQIAAAAAYGQAVETFRSGACPSPSGPSSPSS